MLAGTPAPRRTIAAEMVRLHVPGVSVAVLHGGVIEWAKGYGVTRAGGTPVTPDTLFQAGSISKPVTAFAALRLVQQHRLTLDDDVNAQLKGWKLPTPAGEHVTLRELLSHTAGTTVQGFPGYAAGVPVPSVDEVLTGRSPASTKPVVVDTAPGTAWRYSGGGYTVVQKLIGDVTGRPFTQVLSDEVLLPAGMKRSSFAQPLAVALLANAAWPHDGTGKPVTGGPHTYPELAAAGLWSTPGDLLRYAVAVRDSARGKTGALLDQAIATEMLTPGKGDYGLGLEVRGALADRDFSHGGSNEGYENFLVAYIGSGDGVAVMTNGAQGNELGLEITRGVAAAYGWPETFAKHMARRFNLASQSTNFSVTVNDVPLPEDVEPFPVQFDFHGDYEADERPDGLVVSGGWGNEILDDGNSVRWRIRFSNTLIDAEEFRGVSVFCGVKIAQNPFFST
ncbi:serine hydrolase domain-containing protein [Sphingomonas sp. PB2P19]|uniref:serine hydrolase domain-containing protein n=1 Tax=Sphingomonas rhamnosi TaxID=3096156 RepID=UPI002FC63280